MNLANMKRSETTEQINLFNWAKRNESILPELALMYHVPNEGKRSNGNVLKAMGLKSGVPDVVLPVPNGGSHGLYLEMKFGNNKPTKEQEAYMRLLRGQGYKTAVCYSTQEAIDTILGYLQTPGRMPLQTCLNAPWIAGKCDGILQKNKMFLESECGKCPHNNPPKEERILKENLEKVERSIAETIVKGIYYLSYGKPLDGQPLEDTLENINKTLALLVKCNDLTIKQSAAVLDVAINAYKCGTKGENKQ